MELSSLKKQLIEECKRYVDVRINTARESMHYAQQSANEESKSSVGDKYETGRAMMQIERDKAAHQLEEAIKLKNTLDNIQPDATAPNVTVGSLVITDKRKIFISIGIGKLILKESEFFVVAPTSPLGSLLMGKKIDDQLIFNNEQITILQIV